MERKIIKNNEISQKPFLITLLKIFNSIQDELKKLPLFDCKHFLQLKGINQSYFHKNVAERLIKKQHEVKLFRETYDQIIMMNKKKPKARRSDVFMKFSMVSEILLTRMREQLCIKGEAKQATLDSLLKIKDSFMDWGQSYFLSSKNWFQQAKSNNKTTNDYKLKYVFSQIATTNATLKNSRSISKHHKTTNFQPGIEEEAAIDNQDTTFKANPKIRMQRHTVNDLHNRSERRSTKKYTTNFINTEADKRPQQVNAHSEESIKEKQQKPERIRIQKKTKFQDNTDYLKSKNIDNERHQQLKSDSPSQSMILPPQEQQNIKSAYYQSQNYIKSRKNLDNVTIFVNINKSKTKKRISNISNDISSSSQIDTPQNPFQDLNYLQPTEGYRSIKFLTRKYIPEQQTIVVKNAKSEKVLSRRRTALKTAAPATHSVPYEKRPISKIHKEMADDLQEIRLERPEPSKKKFISINEEAIEQPALEVKGTQSNGKNVGEFYAQLGILRTELKKETDPFCQSRSQFFHQQSMLWQEQKRRMQRFLDARNKQMYFRQFEMVGTTSNRDQEDAQRAVRTNIVNFTNKIINKHSRSGKLDQADLSKQGNRFRS